MQRWSIVLAAFVVLSAVRVSAAIETVVLRQGETKKTIEGRLVVEAADGGLVLLTSDGKLWIVPPEELDSRSNDERAFVPLTAEECATHLLREMPPGFRIHQTSHYTICYNTSTVYAEWCGGLYERLYRGFFNYWKNRGWTLPEPEFRLIALVFDSRESFADYARPELGDSVNSIIGYYNLHTNRVNMYDLTGADGVRNSSVRITDAAHINQILSQPGAERTVATIVHEATHQLAYNCGMQTRLAANPLWVSEGLAMFFESPDYKSDVGWKKVGAINRFQLMNFRRSLAQRPPDALLRLLSSDAPFREPTQIGQAYSEAWALNYFLLQRHKAAYVNYLKKLSQLPPLVEQSPEERVKMFKDAFGDLQKLDAEFVKSIQRMNP